MESRNPVLSGDLFQNAAVGGYEGVAASTMSIQGTTVKTGLLLAITVATALISWEKIPQGEMAFGWLIGGAIVGLIVGLITSFKPTLAPFTAPLYAAAQGLFLGGLSVIAEMKFPGIALQAIMATFGVFAAMLILYATRTIQATPGLVKFLSIAILGIMLTYLCSFILSFFGMSIPFLREPSPIGIGIGLFITGVAAFTLILDFHQIEELSNQGAPKSMEWYGAFGLMVTLIWLYIEILRLLMLIAAYAQSNE